MHCELQKFTRRSLQGLETGQSWIVSSRWVETDSLVGSRSDKANSLPGQVTQSILKLQPPGVGAKKSAKTH